MEKIVKIAKIITKFLKGQRNRPVMRDANPASVFVISMVYGRDISDISTTIHANSSVTLLLGAPGKCSKTQKKGQLWEMHTIIGMTIIC